ncbi:MAG: alpha/beta fold hydrolase [Bradymonadales bacterium]|nr:alpha/beta fold hydrolase [Bradymonadales bacterium]
MHADDLLHKLDQPAVNASVFFPRPNMAATLPTGSEEIWVEVAPSVRVEVRYHPADLHLPCILFFHGNGEIAADYDDLAGTYHRLGATLLCADYRGYGRSGGHPSVRALVEDAHPILDTVLHFLETKGHTGPLVVMGRSLGSAPAIELASTRGLAAAPAEGGGNQDRAARGRGVSGLILESGFALTLPLLELLGVPVDALALREVQGLDNEDKIAMVQVPVLLLHAELDWIVPPENAERNYRKAGAEQKELIWIPQADHNTIMLLGGSRYWGSIQRFLRSMTD